MNLFLDNWLPVSALLFISIGAWLFGYVLSRIKKKNCPSAVKILLCAISLLANITLAFLILVWGGGLEHITAVFLLSLLLTLH